MSLVEETIIGDHEKVREWCREFFGGCKTKCDKLKYDLRPERRDKVIGMDFIGERQI